MDVLTAATGDDLFSAIYSGQSSDGLESLANQALQSGIDRYTDGDYKGAAAEFKRALGLSPYSDYMVDTTKYLAQSYLQLDQTDKAIDAYEQSLELNPQSDELYLELGNLYFGQKESSKAIEAYEKAVRIYDDSTNRYSLGQAYLYTGRYEDAETQFEKVIDYDPSNYSGYYGLGQSYAAQERYTEAIQEFERAISKNKEFYDAYLDMGYVYADMGEKAKAEEIVDLLGYEDEDLADLLDSYIHKSTEPKMLTAWTNSSFQFYLGRNTPVSDLGEYLKTADGSQSLSMVFQFSKEMDRDEVENILNWNISRSSGQGPGTDYNLGLSIPDTEVRISPLPTDVYWNEEDWTATVRFTLRQNATADGTIDPSHIVFAFNGKDSDGNAMDEEYDQYMGFTGSF